MENHLLSEQKSEQKEVQQCGDHIGNLFSASILLGLKVTDSHQWNGMINSIKNETSVVKWNASLNDT